jgi:exodeoxyribonuclease VII small subunit
MTVSFEKNLNQLEELVQALEDGDNSLNESLKAFEKGIKLSRLCHNELNKAEQKVEILLKAEGEETKKETFDD